MKWLVALLLCLSVTLVGCKPRQTEISVADVTKAETLILKGTLRPASFLLKGEGRIEGSAEIQMMQFGKVHKGTALSGDVRFQWSGDWYVDIIEVRYIPNGVTGGNLKLIYSF